MLVEQNWLDDLASYYVEGDDDGQHKERLQPARHDGKRDEHRQQRAQNGTDVGNESESTGQKTPSRAFGMLSANKLAPTTTAKPRLVKNCSESTRAMRTAASPTASEVAWTSAPSNRTNLSLR